MTELNMKDDQEKEWPTPIRLAEIDAQQKIMARVDELMTEAAQTKRSTPNASARPFWAQTKVDIPPSEQFGKLSQMTEDDRPPRDEPQPAAIQDAVPQPATIHENPSQTAPPQPAPQAAPNMDMDQNMGETTAISAIRDEVINKMAAPAATSADMEALLERIEATEGQIDKHQQDLTALLKLVRQLAAKKEEKPEPKKVKKTDSGGWGLGLMITLLLIGGIVGWLFWMDPAFMMDIMSKLVNETLVMTIQLLAEFGAV